MAIGEIRPGAAPPCRSALGSEVTCAGPKGHFQKVRLDGIAAVFTLLSSTDSPRAPGASCWTQPAPIMLTRAATKH